MPKPVAYLRKSKVTSNRHVSWEVQEAEVRALAAARGDAELQIISDWNKSGRGAKTRLRTGYLQLRKMIDAGEVSARAIPWSLHGVILELPMELTRVLVTAASVTVTGMSPVDPCYLRWHSRAGPGTQREPHGMRP